MSRYLATRSPVAESRLLACLALCLSLLSFSGCSPRDELNPPPNALPTSVAEAESIGDPETSLFRVVTRRVIGVLDGDTIDVIDEDQAKTRVRFHGIDSPETGQPFGSNAKRFVSERIAGKTVDVREYNLDRYDRTIGDILIDGQRLSVAIVRAGLAWHYVQYAPDDHELAAAELEAREANRGLWADKRHVAPWDWRRLSKAERDKLR